MKYLGVCIDEKLTRSVHFNELFLQLAKHSAMLYQNRDYVTPHTLNMKYYSLVYSSVNHGINVWGKASQNRLHEMNVRMNNDVRTTTRTKKFSHVSHLYE